jgi:hypothetical protein
MAETEIQRQQQEAMWDLAETRTNFFIPGLFRVLGVTLHCYISAAVAFGTVGVRIALQWIHDLIEWLVNEKDVAGSDAAKAAATATGSGDKKAKATVYDPQSDAVSGWMAFYTKWLYNPISDCWNRPIIGLSCLSRGGIFFWKV